jgi:hypothetical protein
MTDEVLEWKQIKARGNRREALEATAADGGTLRIEWFEGEHQFGVSYHAMFERRRLWGYAPNLPAAKVLAEDINRKAAAHADWLLEMQRRDRDDGEPPP